MRDDAERGALLLERLGPSLFDLAPPIEERHEILCTTAMRFWRPAPDCGLPTGAEKAVWLADYIVKTWEATDRPCSERAVAHALTCAERRRVAHDDERAVLVHGDVHQWNALQADHGFKLVDPDGLLAEAEYDLGIVMREDPVELLEGDPRERARWLAARTGLDATAIWEWGVVERVSTGLYCAEDRSPTGRTRDARDGRRRGAVDRSQRTCVTHAPCAHATQVGTRQACAVCSKCSPARAQVAVTSSPACTTCCTAPKSRVENNGAPATVSRMSPCSNPTRAAQESSLT